MSQQYLDRCERYGITLPEETTIGTLIEIDDEYFTKSFERFFEAGLGVAQAAYRRLFPDQLEDADKALNNLAIKFLDFGDWKLAELISDYYVRMPEKLRYENSEFYYYALIDRAIVQYGAGKEFEAGLEGVHWNSFHPKCHLALHVLKQEYEAAGKLMTNQAVIEHVKETDFRNWPLFRDFRETPEFKMAYREAFGTEYELRQEDVDAALNEGAGEPEESKTRMESNG